MSRAILSYTQYVGTVQMIFVNSGWALVMKEIRLFSSRADEKSLLDEAASPRDGGSVGLRAVMVRAMRGVWRESVGGESEKSLPMRAA